MVKVVALDAPKAAQRLGFLEGAFTVPDDFDEMGRVEIERNVRPRQVRLLLDTHLLLWAAAQTAKLPSAARALLADESSQLLFSAASLWEIAIKRGLGSP